MKLSYTSVRFIRIQNNKLALMYYLLTLIIFSYVIGWQIIYSKTYQSHDTLVGDITTKLKGSTRDQDNVIYDTNDLVNPALEHETMFLTTKIIHTNQSRSSRCPGKQRCTTDAGCREGDYGAYTKSGKLTHTCIDGQCEIIGWCPVEDDSIGIKEISDTLAKWSIFIKVNVNFPNFHVRRSNAANGIKKNVNFFRIDDILQKADTNYEDAASDGAVIVCSVSYDCNLDYSDEDCEPTFTFDRIDLHGFSTGFNFRYVRNNGPDNRVLTKLYGIRFVFTLDGIARKFDPVTLMISLGAGLGLLGISRLICDTIMQYALPNREEYVKHKYNDVLDPEDGKTRGKYVRVPCNTRQ